MSIGKRLVVLVGISTVFGIEGLWLLVGFLTQSTWICVITSGIIALTIYFFYVRLYRKKKAKYPMVPPEGKTDIYFPRTDIPRPVYADFRRIQEKKHWLAKMKKKIERKKK